mgnify:CR=1 FL=1
MSLLRYDNGNLYWLPRDNISKQWNKRYAGKKAGTLKKEGYIQVKLEDKISYAHRIIWEMFNGEIPKNMEVDHINDDRADNRIENLQLLTRNQNSLRISSSKGFGKKGNQYQATKQYKGVHHYLGLFGTACGAYMANRTFFIGEKYDSI